MILKSFVVFCGEEIEDNRDRIEQITGLSEDLKISPGEMFLGGY